ncbi:tRNA lysidine(34) synthetase TilS [Chryseobacterium luquanense]|uniref:tRNA(Ile)-lysidine synthase n=1 Tax=Chryseobacterium luquanense TaxID=2983766 RepID=A0ABT3Y6I9_9FLAO|nr:tRNA lysidine(34) synthetase TilS [Chryseobacterium luquanense]MCX8533738.1 tRNA lysidine(34) synthetase TilS [Chryseobacterium luquanense]
MLSQLTFEKRLQNLIKTSNQKTYLLAVSGGADSMVLAFLFNELRISGCKFQVAHINYKLRGGDSDSDQKIVEDFCKKNNVKFHLYEASQKDEKPENSIQLWARELRYRFFREIQLKENLYFLVTAHHLNDQLETFIINLSKASGINGLSGIPANENNILRPLLNFSKEEIYRFAEENKIDFREDLSNKKSDYLRNKIRNEIVPKLSETNEQFLENFRKSILYLNQTKDFVNQQINEIEKNLSIKSEENIILNKEKLNQETDFIQFEILKKYGFNQPEEIQKIFTAETGSSFNSKEFKLIINRNELIFIKLNSNTAIQEEIILTNTIESNQKTSINLSQHIEIIDEINKDLNWKFDAEKVTHPLKLRVKKEGDLFYPIGFSGKKKVSKFFKDEKLSILAKQKIWLLTDGNDAVLGIIPFRQDRRYAKDEKTQKVLTIFNQK